MVRKSEGLLAKRAGKDGSGNWRLVSDHPAWEPEPWGEAEGDRRSQVDGQGTVTLLNSRQLSAVRRRRYDRQKVGVEVVAEKGLHQREKPARATLLPVFPDSKSAGTSG